MFDDLIYVRNALLRVAFCFFVCALCFFALPTQYATVHNVTIIIPAIEGESISERVMGKIRADLVPEGVSLVTSSPLDPFTTKATLSVVLAFAVTFPYFLIEFFLFVRSALYPKEGRALAYMLFLSFVLFIAGAVFAYMLVIPLVFSALFSYLPLGIAPYYNVRELISLVVGLTFAISLIFLLPVVMVMLSKTGLIPPLFWRTYARHAVLLVLLLSAIITPDGSGVSMVLLALPICVLYTAGYIGSALISVRHTAPTNH